jgi:hypothetical protein
VLLRNRLAVKDVLKCVGPPSGIVGGFAHLIVARDQPVLFNPGLDVGLRTCELILGASLAGAASISGAAASSPRA